MLPDREGRFKARILEHGVSETGPNNLATFVCRFQLVQELSGAEWIHVDQDLDITGYFYLEKKDGSLNSITIDNLKAAFGWDGRDPFWLQDSDFSEHVVQVKLAIEEYNGKSRVKVKYVDAEHASPTDVPQADDNERRTIGSRLGAKFRANAGGTPVPAPKPATSRPTPPAPPAPPATKAGAPSTSKPLTPAPSNAGAATASLPQTATMQQAWEALVKACPPKWAQADIESEWFRILGELFPGKTPEALSPQEWGIVVAEAPGKVVPL